MTSAANKWKTFIRAVRFTAKDNPGIWPMTFVTAILDALFPYIGILLSSAILRVTDTIISYVFMIRNTSLKGSLSPKN